MKPEPLFSPSGQRYFLQKCGTEKNVVGFAVMGDGEGWAWSLESELRSLVRDSVTSKIHKLRDVPTPWILLLLDRHYVATTNEYEAIRDQLRSIVQALNLGKFHSVYIIDWRSQVFPLHPPKGGEFGN